MPAGSSAFTFEASSGCDEIFAAIGFSVTGDCGVDVPLVELLLVELLDDELEPVVVLVVLAGLFVGVGIPPTSEGTIQLSPWEFFMKDPTLIYSAVGTVQDMRELVDLAAAGKVRSHVGRTGSLSDLGAIFDELQAGSYLGRAVVTDLSS